MAEQHRTVRPTKRHRAERKGRKTEPGPDRVRFEGPGASQRDNAQGRCTGEARNDPGCDPQTADRKERGHELDDQEDRHDDKGLTERVEPSSFDLRGLRELPARERGHQCERRRDRPGIHEGDQLEKA